VELQQAKEIIKNALNVAVQKGCFSIDDVAVIIEALKANEESVSFEILHKDEIN
jgi:hypothetical protein